MKGFAIFLGLVAIGVGVVFMALNPESKSVPALIGLGGFALTLIGFLMKKSET